MIRIDDRFLQHPKFVRAIARASAGGSGIDVVGYWLAVMTHARITGGSLEADMAAVVAPGVAAARGVELAAILADVGLLDRVDGGYVVHDFEHWGDDHEEAVALRKAQHRERQRKYRERKATRDASDSGSDVTHRHARDAGDASHNHGGDDPVPSRPVPSRAAEDASAAPVVPTTEPPAARSPRRHPIDSNLAEASLRAADADETPVSKLSRDAAAIRDALDRHPSLRRLATPGRAIQIEAYAFQRAKSIPLVVDTLIDVAAKAKPEWTEDHLWSFTLGCIKSAKPSERDTSHAATFPTAPLAPYEPPKPPPPRDPAVHRERGAAAFRAMTQALAANDNPEAPEKSS